MIKKHGLIDIKSSGRAKEIDGLRGVAILSVALYHYFQRFPDHYPYSNTLLYPASLGYMGVHLFFMISGFAIAHTINNNPTPLSFIIHRIFRLWPPILICAILTFTILHMIDSPFAEERRGIFSDFIPSLTFTPPLIWKYFIKTKYIDGAYWSLFVEVRFYFWSMLLLFLFLSRNFIYVLSVFSSAIFLIQASATSVRLLFILDMLFFVQYLPLFLAGALTHFASTTTSHKTLALIAFAACLPVEFAMLKDATEALVVTIFFFIFGTFVLRRHWLSWAKSRSLTWVGAISYSMYLLHQYIGVALITLLPPGLSDLVYYVFVLTILLFIMLLSCGVYILIERPSQRIARQLENIIAGYPQMSQNKLS